MKQIAEAATDVIFDELTFTKNSADTLFIHSYSYPTQYFVLSRHGG